VVPVLIFMAASPCTTPARAAGAPTPRYVRVKMPSGAEIYVQFRGDQLRTAATVVGLAKAKPVKAKPSSSRASSSRARYTFPEVQLPVEKQQLPAGFSKALAVFTYQDEDRDSYVTAKLGLSRADAKGAVWTYWVTAYAQASDKLSGAQAAVLSNLGKLTLEAKAEPESGRQVGIAVTAKAGGVLLDDVTRNGKSVMVKLTVLDAQKKVAVATSGPLGKFAYG
jgi:hypothetical protein